MFNTQLCVYLCSDSVGKIRINLSMYEDVVNKAKEIGFNISKTCENALNEAIRRLEGSSSSRDPGIFRKPYSNNVETRAKGDRATIGSRQLVD